MTGLTRVSGRITFLPLDVTDRYSIENAYRAIIQGSGGKLDIIFHPATFRNLGMAIESSHITPMWLVPLSIELNRVFAGMVIVAKGCIQFIGSLLASWPDSTHPEYCAGKAALDVYVRDTKIAMRPLGVDVFMFSPKRP